MTKEKRDKLILTVLLTMAAVAGIWSGLLQPQKATLKDKLTLVNETQEKLRNVRRALGLMERYKQELAAAQQKLNGMEGRMPSGDVYRWAIRALAGLQTNSVEFANFEPPRVGDSTILPKVPYKATVFFLKGTAYYHDFGKFLANLENSFPHLRLQKLELEPLQFGEATTEAQQQLSYRLEILALITP